MGAQNLFVGQARQALGTRLAPFRLPSTRALYRRPLQVGLARKIVHNAIVRFLQRPLLGHSGIDRNAPKHITIPSIAGLLPGLAIGLQVHPQLQNIHAA